MSESPVVRELQDSPVVHAWSHKKLNGFLCGKRGGSPLVTGHFSGITCGNCRRIILNSEHLRTYYKIKEWLEGVEV